MSDCDDIQHAITEGVALAGREPPWQEPISGHLAGCASCREMLRQEVELARLLEEPSPLPPAGLIPEVMARIAAEPATALSPAPPASGLAWAERFAWAASGAVAMACLERLPSLSAPWLADAQLSFFSVLSSLAVPLEVNGLYLVVLALGLLAAQGVMVYQVRTSR
jgi:predicted anti-sigma-YlaC factor YlaD